MQQSYLRCLVLFIFLPLGLSLMAQLPEDQATDFQATHPEMSFFMRYLQPTGALAENGYRPGVGVSFEIMSRPLRDDRPISLQFGGNFSYDHGGRESFDVRVDYPYPSDAALSLSNAQVGAHGVARLITSVHQPLQAYVQGLVGTRWFVSQERLDVDDLDELDHDDEYCPEPETVASRATLSYGLGAGFRMRLGEGAWLDMRGTYLMGTGPRYVNLASARPVEENIVVYDLASAPRNDQWSLSVGITFQLKAEDGADEEKATSDGSSWVIPAMIFSGCH